MEQRTGEEQGQDLSHLLDCDLLEIVTNAESHEAETLDAVVREMETRNLVQECDNHPGQRGVNICRGCFVSICDVCRFPSPEGLSLCPACVEISASKEESASGVEVEVEASVPTTDPRVDGLKCSVHPDNDAVQLCQTCGSRVCKTCDFSITDSVHLCPTCASRPQTELSRSRRNRLIGSFALAALATLAFILIMGGAIFDEYLTEEEETILGGLMTITILVPTVVGLALGMGVKDKRLYNPATINIAIAWNAVLLSIFLLLSVVGNFM